MRLQTTLLALAIVTISAFPARAQAVRIVNQPALGTFATLQAAINAATQDDVLLVAAGSYAAFTIDNKSLWIEAMQPGTVNINGTITINNVAANKTVVLVGLNAIGASAGNQSDPALRATSNKGQLRFDRCQFTGGMGSIAGVVQGPYGAAGDGASFTGCASVLFLNTTSRGGVGGSETQVNNFGIGGFGGDGVRANSSRVVCYDSRCIGGWGGTAGNTGGRGGDGYHGLAGFGVFAENTRCEGGRGGDAWDFAQRFGGNGGKGITLDAANNRADAFGCMLVGGAAGGGFVSGQPGTSTAGIGSFQVQSLGPRSCTALPITSDATGLTVTVSGELGDRAFLLVGTTIGYSAVQPVTGVLLVDATPPLDPIPLGIIGSSGSVTATLPLPDMPGPSRAQVARAQVLVATLQGTYVLGSPLNLVVLDRAAQPDCDGNGVLDYLDMIEVPTSDCHHDLQLDRCQISSGTSIDCNGNTVPDECDIASGTSLDINHNNIPDDCDAPGGPDWYVDPSAPPGGNGSISAPFQEIQQAIFPVQSGQRIRLADGIYVGPGNRNIDFNGKSFAIESLNGPSNCIIDCQFLGRAFHLHSAEVSARIEGVTIRNGSAPEGGGIRSSSFGQPVRLTVRNCVVENCSATVSGGGGAYLFGSTTVERCTFRGNTSASFGGGLYLTALIGAQASISACTFDDNQGGGGLAINGNSQRALVSHCVITRNGGLGNACGGVGTALNGSEGMRTVISHCLIAGNRGTGAGGVAVVSADIDHCTIVDNDGVTVGGGIRVDGNVRLRNCIVWNNTAAMGSQASVGPASTMTFENCDLQGGPLNVHRQATASTVNWGAGSFDLDPLFVDADGPDNNPATLLDNDYRLSVLSPCIDAGNNSLVSSDVLDLDGDGDVLEPVPFDLSMLPRFYDQPAVVDTGVGIAPIVDMGCYEQQP